MKKKLYVALCLSLAMALPGVVNAAQHQENIGSSAYGFVNVKPANTSLNVMFGSKQDNDQKKPPKWQEQNQQNNQHQYPDKDNEGNHYGNDKENPGNHYGNDKENPGNHYGADKEKMASIKAMTKKIMTKMMIMTKITTTIITI